MLSALITTPPWRLARSTASADLPLAVGPVIRIAFTVLRRFSIMALVATVVANPSNPVLTPEIADQGAEARKGAGRYALAYGVPGYIALRDGTDAQAAEANIPAVKSNAPIDLVIQE